MSRIAYLSLLLLSGLGAFAQAAFEKGYFIGLDDKRVDCKIMIPEWNRTPTEFLYKLNDSAEVRNAGPSSVKEFGVGEGSKLISAMVDLDISSDDEANPSEIQEPDWYKQRIFLLVLVDGEASLYEYNQTTIKRYFYKGKKQPLGQLINKIFRFKDDNPDMIRTNASFRQQLWQNVRIEGEGMETIEKLEYDKSDLVRYFTEYDQKSGVPYTVKKRKKESPGFSLRITPGGSYSLFKVVNYYYQEQVFDFPGQLGFRLGMEAELIIPYTNRTVGLVLEPTYQYFNVSAMSMGQEMSVKLSFIEFPVGARYYLFFTKDLRGFADIYYIPGFAVNFNSEVTLDGSPTDVSFKRSIAAGTGIAWKRFGAEFRWYSNKNILNGMYLASKYSRFCFILSYQLFRTKPNP